MANRSFRDEIMAYIPANEQEAGDLRAIRWYMDQYGDGVLLRDNVIAHMTSSGFIMNETLDQALMIHHNILGKWAWTGGHADGDFDPLAVALREAREETGARSIRPLAERVASVDVLTVEGHVKRGRYVNAHLHLNVAYVLLCDQEDAFRAKPDENSGVRWFDVEEIARPAGGSYDAYLYGKLIGWARGQRKGADA
ncbi:NUDIX hydrolase [Eubacteriales bacterium OttesenSCG-928-A19]|nr:NUDIX hydrolase [Eubacteriales bacterium OttesenSCG-928-A19]